MRVVEQEFTISFGIPSPSVSISAHSSNGKSSSTSIVPSSSSSVSQRLIVPSESVSSDFNQSSVAGRSSPISPDWSPLRVVSPCPSWPFPLFPQHLTCPSSRIAQDEALPNATDSTWSPISVTIRLSPISLAPSPIVVVLPIPNWP